MPRKPEARSTDVQEMLDFSSLASAPSSTLVPPLVPPLLEERPKIYSVGELVRAAGRTLEARYAQISVEGEISNLSQPRSGHIYFTLKDAAAQLPAVLFRTQAARLRCDLADGMLVRARGKLSIYEGQGKFQLYVDTLEPAGLGALQLQFEALKQKLFAEGLFDSARKRPLPAWPKTVGIVTSPTGAAIRDMVRIAARRGRVCILLSPCSVQGAQAPREILNALERLWQRPEVDVIIVGRGGGSAEDLAPFNDETLARAIARSPVPIVSAVGHEVDFTIADFVADLRAPTPSAAAELVVPLFSNAQSCHEEMGIRLRQAGERIFSSARQRLDADMEHAEHALLQRIAIDRRALDVQTRRLAICHPQARIARDRQTLNTLKKQLDAKGLLLLNQRRQLLGQAAAKLDALSPLSVLSRGYALARTKAGKVIDRAEDVQVGEPISVRLHHGSLDCKVERIEASPKS